MQWSHRRQRFEQVSHRPAHLKVIWSVLAPRRTGRYIVPDRWGSDVRVGCQFYRRNRKRVPLMLRFALAMALGIAAVTLAGSTFTLSAQEEKKDKDKVEAKKFE